jgi:hypothetical protein
MRSRLNRFRPTPAVVISVIAVFFAIGGIGYAASKIGTNNLKKGAVTQPKLHGNSVGSGKVIDHSLRCHDLKNGCVQGPRGPQGPQGVQGVQGNPGPPGGVNFNTLLRNFGTQTKTVGKFTLTQRTDGAGNCQDTKVSSTADAHVNWGTNASNPFAGVALTNGNSHTVTIAVGNFSYEDIVAVADDGSSQMLGFLVGCQQQTGAGPSITWGSLSGN